MFVLKKVGESSNIPYREFVCDEKSDLSSIDTRSCSMGSICYIISTGNTYILNSKKEWKLYVGTSSGGNGGNGDGGGTLPDDTVIYDVVQPLNKLKEMN